MARIYGPSNGHGTLDGTSGSDLIVASDSYNTITGGGGDDSVLAKTGGFNDIVLGSSGDGLRTVTDTIRLDGIGDTVSAGDENVRITGMASNSVGTFGSGNENIVVRGSGNQISATDGNDTIKLLGGSNSVNLTSYQSALKYTDDIAFSGTDNKLTIALAANDIPDIGTVTVSGGSGYGTFNLGSSIGTLVTRGYGNFVQAGFNSQIAPGSGYDTVSLNAGPRASGATNVVTLAGTHNLVEGLGAGFDSITGGAGYDTVNISLEGGTADIGLRGQDDVVTVNALVGSVNVFDGGSYESVTLDDSSSASLTFNGVGDSAYLGSMSGIAAHTSIADQSSGLHVVLDKQQFMVSDHISIADFDPTGVIDFKDGRGGFTSVSQVMADLHPSVNGSYTLALPDGSGTITILNDINLTAANFKIG